MRLEQSFEVPVPVARAWEVFLDLERVAPCMPGATLTSFDGTSFAGTVKVKLGPISLAYRGTGRFTERDEAARRLAFVAQGQDSRGAGGASARVTAVLHDAGGSATVVKVVADLDIAGKAAQFGRGMIADVSGKLVKQFADCLADTITASAGAPAVAPAVAPAPVAAPEPVAVPAPVEPALDAVAPLAPPPLAPVFSEPASPPPVTPPPPPPVPAPAPQPVAPVFPPPPADWTPPPPPPVETPAPVLETPPPVVEAPPAAVETPAPAAEYVPPPPPVEYVPPPPPVEYVPPTPSYSAPPPAPEPAPVSAPAPVSPVVPEAAPAPTPAPTPAPPVAGSGLRQPPVEAEPIDLLAVSGAKGALRKAVPLLVIVGLVVIGVVVWLLMG